jgi:hypothetical protein
MIRKLISSMVIASLIATSAQAALLSNVQGSVIVNRGDGFQPAQGGTSIAPGDRVRVIAGSAEIVYENGCVVKLGQGQMVAVLNTPPACRGTSPATAKSAGPAGSSDMTYYYIGGGLVLAGGLGAGALFLVQKAVSP